MAHKRRGFQNKAGNNKTKTQDHDKSCWISVHRIPVEYVQEQIRLNDILISLSSYHPLITCDALERRAGLCIPVCMLLILIDTDII